MQGHLDGSRHADFSPSTDPSPTSTSRPAAGRLAAAVSGLLACALAALFSAGVDAQPTVDLADLDGSQGFTVSNDSAMITFVGVGAAIGDVNGDDVEDFAWAGSDDTRHPIYIFFGRPGGFPDLTAVSQLDGSNGFALADSGARLEEATSVAAVGDVNGDGLDDFAVGAAQASPSTPDVIAFVVYGRDGSFPAALDYQDLDGTNGFLISDFTDLPTDEDGVVIRGAGDLNGDERDDLVLGSPFANSESDFSGDTLGAAFVIYGRATNFPALFALDDLDGTNGFVMPGPPDAIGGDGRAFGSDVAALGDVNGDDRDDLAIGHPSAPGAGSEPEGFGVGRVRVVYGRASDFPATLDVTSLGSSEGFTVLSAGPPEVIGSFGYSIAAAGDVDGDTHRDLLVGAPASRPILANSNTGMAFVVYGATTTAAPIIAGEGGGARVTGLTFDETTDPPKPELVGAGIDVAAGDIDGDGRPDQVIGSSGSTAVGGPSSAGLAFVVYGREGRPASIDLLGLDPFTGYHIAGEGAADFAGITVATGDVAGSDGRAEVLVGGEGFMDEPDGSLQGAAHAILGAPSLGIFRDGFETGDTSAWSSTQP